MYWLSFCDGDLPKGQQFLGVAIVRGSNLEEAVSEAWRLGINPGGEVLSMEILVKNYSKIPIECIDKLLSLEEVKKYFSDFDLKRGGYLGGDL
jgi:hypothetical protein